MGVGVKKNKLVKCFGDIFFYEKTEWKSKNKAMCAVLFKEIEGFSGLAS